MTLIYYSVYRPSAVRRARSSGVIGKTIAIGTEVRLRSQEREFFGLALMCAMALRSLRPKFVPDHMTNPVLHASNRVPFPMHGPSHFLNATIQTFRKALSSFVNCCAARRTAAASSEPSMQNLNFLNYMYSASRFNPVTSSCPPCPV